jgi:hypothetical protein
MRRIAPKLTLRYHRAGTATSSPGSVIGLGEHRLRHGQAERPHVPFGSILPSVGATRDEDHHRSAHGAGQWREKLDPGRSRPRSSLTTLSSRKPKYRNSFRQTDFRSAEPIPLNPPGGSIVPADTRPPPAP